MMTKKRKHSSRKRMDSRSPKQFGMGAFGKRAPELGTLGPATGRRGLAETVMADIAAGRASVSAPRKASGRGA